MVFWIEGIVFPGKLQTGEHLFSSLPFLLILARLDPIRLSFLDRCQLNIPLRSICVSLLTCQVLAPHPRLSRKVARRFSANSRPKNPSKFGGWSAKRGVSQPQRSQSTRRETYNRKEISVYSVVSVVQHGKC